MKIKIKNTAKNIREMAFPCLLSNEEEGIVILATAVYDRSFYQGVVIKDDGLEHVVGQSYHDFRITEFKIFVGKVVLKN